MFVFCFFFPSSEGFGIVFGEGYFCARAEIFERREDLVGKCSLVIVSSIEHYLGLPWTLRKYRI